jgi:hypothetical protein
MSNLGLLSLSLLGLTMGGTLIAVIKSAEDKPPLAWWEYALFVAMVVCVGIVLAMAPMVPWG